jgi:hypothetical protein
MPAIPAITALGRWRKEFEASLGCTASPYLNI